MEGFKSFKIKMRRKHFKYENIKDEILDLN